MKVLIVSDTHGYDDNFYKVYKEESPLDYVIHAGDVHESADAIRAAVNCPIRFVAGNNDYSRELRKELEFDLNGFHVLLVHGHYEHVYYGRDTLIYKAASRGAKIVIYGHTHVPSVEFDETYGIWAVNPGSLTLPRQQGRRPSYIIMNIGTEGLPSFDIKYL